MAVRNDASAYGYSLLVTTTFGAANVQIGSPSVNRVFAFAIGAALAFFLVEAAVSNLFRQRLRAEPSDVVILGSALHLVSVVAGLGVGALVAWLVGGWLAWLLAPFAATVVYIVLTGANMAAAHLAEERHPPEKSG